MSTHNWRLGLVSLLTLGVLCGCGPKPVPVVLPTVHKVIGKVQGKDRQPVTSGTLQFEALASPGRVAIGEVQADGTFQMRTMVDGERLDGVVAGPQRVTYIPRSTQDPAGTGPVVLPKNLEVKPQDNVDLTLQL
jgi:hypothetical protein